MAKQVIDVSGHEESDEGVVRDHAATYFVEHAATVREFEALVLDSADVRPPDYARLLTYQSDSRVASLSVQWSDEETLPTEAWVEALYLPESRSWEVARLVPAQPSDRCLDDVFHITQEGRLDAITDAIAVALRTFDNASPLPDPVRAALMQLTTQSP